MTLSEFLESLSGAAPPDLPPSLLALWRDAKGDWDGAHDCVTAESDPKAMWVHAYLHRKHGDASNARYWYSRVRRTADQGPLDDEWRVIATALLDKGARG